MGKIKQITIDTFSGLMATDPRDKDLKKFYHSKHFDAFSYPHKLEPKFSTANTNTGDYVAIALSQFVYADSPTGNYAIFALGQRSDNKATVVYWDEDNDVWIDTGLSGNLSATADAPFNAGIKSTFFTYKGYAYWLAGTTKLQRIKTDDGAGGVVAYQTLTAFTYGARPLHHSQDDIAYFPVDNLIYKLNNTTWSGPALTLPANTYISQICEYGDYIAIAVNYIYEIKSTVYFWDRNSSVVTTTKKMNIPSSKIYQMGVLNGRLMAVSTDFIKIYVHTYNGSEMQIVNELNGVRKSFLEDQMSRDGIIFDERFLFPMNYDAPGYATDLNTREGLWSVDSRGKITLDFVVEGASGYKGLIYALGDLYIAHGTTEVAKSTTTYSLTNPSVYETLFLGDLETNKTFLSVATTTEVMPDDGKIVLKYRLTEASAWTTIFSHSTNGSTYHQAINIESTGARIEDFREMQFRVESTGGAVLTGLSLRYEEKDDNLN